MKKKLIFLLIFSLFLGGCDQKASSGSSLRVAIIPGMSYATVFVFSDDSLAIYNGNIPVFDIREVDLSNYDSITVELSESEKNDIIMLIEKLENTEPYEGTHPPISMDGDEVQASIGNQLYRSMYQTEYHNPDSETVNTALLDLVYQLIALSPVDVGVEGPQKVE